MNALDEIVPSICVVATAREMKDGDRRLERLLRALGDSENRTLWVLDDISSVDDSMIPQGVRLVGRPEEKALLLIHSTETLIAFISAGESNNQRLVWMKFETVEALPQTLRIAALRYLQNAVGVCATSQDDASRWAAELGRRPEVVDLGAFERRLMRGAEPLIEAGATPRILIDLGGAHLDERATEVHLALHGEECEIWHIHSGELRPWMRPDMQFLVIPDRDRGLFYGAVDAAVVDEGRCDAADLIKDYLAAGVVPIPLSGGALCREPLSALGLHAVADTEPLKARIGAWLTAAASRPDLRRWTAIYAEAKDYLAADGEDLARALCDAHRRQSSILAGAGHVGADTLSQRIALDTANRSWRRWEEARPSSRGQASDRIAVRVEGWVAEETDEASCELLLLSPTASARLGRLFRIEPLNPESAAGPGRQPRTFAAECLLPIAVDVERLSEPGHGSDELTVVAVGAEAGVLGALRRTSSSGESGGSRALLRALSRQEDTRQSQAGISGEIGELMLTPTRAVSIPSRDIDAGQSLMRALDDAGNPVTSGLWLSLEGVRHCDLVPLNDVSQDGVRQIDEALREVIKRSHSLTFWSRVVAIAAVHIYDPD